MHHGINPEVHANKWRERHANLPKSPTSFDAIHGIRESVPRDLSRGRVHHGINPEVHANKWRERHPNLPKTPASFDAIHGIRESVPRDLSRGTTRDLSRGLGFFTADSAEHAEVRGLGGFFQRKDAKAQGTSKERGSGFEHDDRILRMNMMGRFEGMLSG